MGHDSQEHVLRLHRRPPALPGLPRLHRHRNAFPAPFTSCQTPKTDSTPQTLYPQNYQETVKEWTGVFGYDATKPAKAQSNFPHSGYTTDSWGIDSANPLGKVQGIYALNVGHTVPINGTQDLMWFQLGPYATK